MKPEELQLVNKLKNDLEKLTIRYNKLDDLFYRSNQIDKYFFDKPLVLTEQICKGQMHLDTGTTLAFTGTTYEKIIGTWSNVNPKTNNKFYVDSTNNRLVYTGKKSVICLFNGVSDIKVDKACEITYALFKNGSLVSGAETPHSFASPSKYSTISITALTEVQPDDYFEVYAKCDDATVTLTINSLLILFFGEL